MPRKIESLFIPGPAGRLEAILEEPESEVTVEIASPPPEIVVEIRKKLGLA